MFQRYLLAVLMALSSICCNAQYIAFRDGVCAFALFDSTVILRDAGGFIQSGDTGDNLYPDEGTYVGDFVVPKKVASKEKYVPVSEIFGGAFYYCPDLESITAEDSMYIMGPLDVTGCKNLKRISMKLKFDEKFYQVPPRFHPFDIIVAKTMVDINKPIPHNPGDFVSRLVFRQRLDGILQKGVRYLIFNDMAYVVGVDTSANLSKVVVEKSVAYKGKKYPVKAVMTRAFEETDVKEVVLPNTIEYIGEHAFSKCSKLHTVRLPNSVEYLGNGVFYNCASLKQLTLSSKLTFLSEECFNGCASLEEIDIPASVQLVCYGWNQNCPKLKTIKKHSDFKTED